MLFSQEACDACRGFIESMTTFGQQTPDSNPSEQQSGVKVVEENNPPQPTLVGLLTSTPEAD